jgi:hypothetical protein
MRSLLCLLVLGIGVAGAWADTDITSDISANTTWDLAGSPYNVLNSITIHSSATLTIDAGVTVKLNNSVTISVGRYWNLNSSDRGALQALGTLAQPVTFTRSGAYNWGGIRFDGRGYAPMASRMSRCNLTYGGRSQAGVLVFASHSNVTQIDECTISASESKGIECDSSSYPTIADNSITGCATYPVRIAARYVDSLQGNSYSGNGTDAISIYGDVTRSLTWPNEGVPYRPDGSFSIYESATLTLEAGTSVGMDNSQVITVGRYSSVDSHDRGALLAVGNPGDPILFYQRGASNWGGLAFEGRGYDPLQSTLAYCQVPDAGRGSSGAVVLRGHDAVVMDNCTISGSESCGAYCASASRLDFRNGTITGSAAEGLKCDSNSRPMQVINTAISDGASYAARLPGDVMDTLSSNTYTNNNPNGIAVFGDVTHSLTWPNECTLYHVDSTFTIWDGATLTIEPGISVGLHNSHLINVGRYNQVNATDRGALQALGTPADRITFFRLDAYNWGSLRFDGRGYAPLQSVLAYCTIENAGRSTSGAVELFGHDKVTLDHCTVDSSDVDGVYCSSGDPRIVSSTITGSASEGMYCDGGSYPVEVRGTLFSDNASYAVRMPGNAVDALSGNTYTNNSPNGIAVFGDVTHSLTWLNECTLYHVDSSFTIWNGATLTIEPGISVGLHNSQAIYVGRYNQVNPTDRGALLALGMPSDRITFFRLDAYNWGSLRFDGRGYAPLQSTLRYCTIENGGRSAAGMVELYSHDRVTLDHCAVDSSDVDGVYCSSGKPRILSGTINASASEGLYCDSGSYPVEVRDTVFSNGGSYAVRMPANAVDALSGNTYTNNNPDAIAVSGDITHSLTWLNEGAEYHTDTTITVYNGATLAIDPGSTVALGNSHYLHVGRLNQSNPTDQGGLYAAGTPADPITFRKLSSNKWGAIQFDGRGYAALPSTVRYCNLADGGNSANAIIQMYSHSGVTVSHCEIDGSATKGIDCDSGSQPVRIEATNIHDCNSYPVRIAAQYVDSLAGDNTYADNGVQAISVFGDVTRSLTWPNEGVPYYPDGSLTIYNGATLTLDPSVQVGMENSAVLSAGRYAAVNETDRGGLQAVGTDTEPIALHRRGSYNWGGVRFEGRGYAPLASVVSECEIRDAGRSTDGALVFYGHSNVFVSQCDVLNSETRGAYADADSRPSIHSNRFENGTSEPVRIAANNADALAGNVYLNNGKPYIATYGDVTRSLTWPYEGLPYYPDGGFTVYNGAMLTLSPGAEIGMPQNSVLSVGRYAASNETDLGGLTAEGTPGLPIRIFSRDSYAFGTLRIEGRGYAPPLPSQFRHVVIHRGGRSTIGTLEVYANDDVDVVLSTIVDSDTSGVYVNGCDPLIDTCIAASNTNYGIYGFNAADPTVTYSDSWGNGSDNWLGVAPDGTCIEEDPLFVDAGNADFRLQEGSPCIDTGNPALDVGDGTQADMGAYQFQGPVTSPPGFFNAGWNWFSIPLEPAGSSEASDLLGFNARNILFWWNPELKTYELYPDDFTDLEVKKGYMLRLGGPVTVSYQSQPYGEPQTIPVSYPGATFIGLPSVHDVALADLGIRNLATQETRTAWEDRNSPSSWMNWNWVYWNSVMRQAEICGLSGGDDDTMRSWYGYRVWTYVPDLELILPE